MINQDLMDMTSPDQILINPGRIMINLGLMGTIHRGRIMINPDQMDMINLGRIMEDPMAINRTICLDMIIDQNQILGLLMGM